MDDDPQIESDTIDTFWTEDLTRSRDYDSPFTAVNNVLNRCGPYHQIDYGRQDELVAEILGKIWDYGFKIVRDVDRPEMFDCQMQYGNNNTT